VIKHEIKVSIKDKQIAKNILDFKCTCSEVLFLLSVMLGAHVLRKRCSRISDSKAENIVLSRQRMSSVSYFFQCHFHVLFKQLHYSLKRMYLCNLKELFLFMVGRSDASFKKKEKLYNPIHILYTEVVQTKLVSFRPARTNILIRLVVSESALLFRLGSIYVETTIIF
jgi:hypothetical protein